jgi:hypothetical protein
MIKSIIYKGYEVTQKNSKTCCQNPQTNITWTFSDYTEATKFMDGLYESMTVCEAN